MPADLPVFVYHRDPVGTGNIEVSTTICRACGQARGHIYTGPVFAEEELQDCFCPWCIADGTAHETFDASFTDEAGIGDYGNWEEVADTVVETVAFRTPGFSGWQQERWWTHCHDAAAFLGRVGYKELQRFGEQAISAIAEETGYEAKELRDYMQALDADGSPSAYLFQCLHCGRYGGYSDCD